MQPQELLRAAAKLLAEGEWCQGGPHLHARDGAGRLVSLWIGGGNEGRNKINPAAVSFTIYGAICKAMEAGGGATRVTNLGLMWDTMARIARAEGASGPLHPVIAYNEAPGRTKDEALDYLERCAVAIEAPAESAP